jgi:hypothetical protein
MASIHMSAAHSSRCYRLTPKGRACVELVQTSDQTIGSLSRYLHDVLIMCGSGAWFDQLRQSMPPRSLEESLQALLTLELIECLDVQEPPRKARALSVFGACA